MPERVWLYLEAFTAGSEDDGTGEDIIDRLEQDLNRFSPSKFIHTREQLNVVIAELSRLAMRIRDKPPPH